ncbi:MAG: arsenic efflux protein [Bacteroidales bacterium]|nr:arsenic efflux protein [Bacteroidales bacterium]
MFEPIAHSFEHAIMIASFVLSMMLLIEYVTVQTKNKILKAIGKNIWWQVIIAAMLGIIPGCLGTFVAVSLYAHRVIGFPALVTVMIASSGDEAFVMFSEIPEQALYINLALILIAIIVGFILNLIFKDKNFMKLHNNMLHSHSDPNCVCFDWKMLVEEYKNISFQRLLLIVGSVLFLFFLFTGKIGPAEWNEKKIIFLIVGSIMLFIVATVPEHFLIEHLWKHTIKKHLFRIFLWTFGALLVIEIFIPMLNLTEETFKNISDNYFVLLLLVAVLVGFIPESGPNLVFVFLFASGFIPLSILVANSIVQDGHGGLPLLAESPKSFVYSKLINMVVGFIVGLAGFAVGL